MVSIAHQVIKPISRFQRAIHVRYDLRDQDAVEQYIPTLSASQALRAIIQNTNPQSSQRSHVLYAAYGSGKSHFAVALAALLENSANLQSPIRCLIQRLSDIDSEATHSAQTYVDGEQKLFPVMLSGNEGSFAPAMLRALTRALNDRGITIQLTSRFDTAIETVSRWKLEYPDFFTRLKQQLKIIGYSSTTLIAGLKKHDERAYEAFLDVYAQLTGGAIFDPLVEQSPEIIYRDVAIQLATQGYTGIVVIWDEFGRYLEGHASLAFGNEAAALQSFAETCNYSSERQLHLILFAHKELQGYASALPQLYQQEWSRIEGRFQRHDLSTDPLVAYRLIASAIQYNDPAVVHHYLNDDVVNWLIGWVKDYRLFGTMSDQDIYNLIYNTWPLHPLTVFALAHLSNRVAQNERTMFTFLTSDEPNALRSLLERKLIRGEEMPFIRVTDLWDYFEDAVRADIGGNGAHRYWSGVINALDKVSETDDISKELVKSLGVISICADNNNSVRPTTELLGWASGVETEESQQAVVHSLDNLRRRKVIIHRQIDGYWTFITGSDINFEELLRTTLERVNPTSAQLRRLLEQTIPAPYTLARRYNQQKSVIRYFLGAYRWSSELLDTPWDLLIEQDKSDGLVVYVLVTDELSWQKAYETIQPNDQVVYVLPKEGQPLISLLDVLRELFALQEINNDASLRQHDDRERIQREIDWLLEDTEERLGSIVRNLIDPRREKSVWITIQDDVAKGHYINNTSQTTKLVSDICDRVFSKTPALNSEGLNKHKPTPQQNRAAELVIDALFSHEPSETFGMEGHGPEILALNALLKIPGILQQNELGWWIVDRPVKDAELAEVWNVIQNHLDMCTGSRQPVSPIIHILTSPPYGLREGVIPVLLAAILRSRLMVTSIWRDRSPISTIDGPTILKIVEKPDDYSIEINHWSPVLDALRQVLISRFDEYIQDIERNNQVLAKLRSGMTRWLQGLPAFCRFTTQISGQANKFRDVIRKVQTEPSKAIFETLPRILELNELSNAEEIAVVIDRLMREISNAYYDLQRRLDVFVANEFGYGGLTQDGQITLKAWVSGLHSDNGKQVKDFKFSSTLTQNVVNVLQGINENDGLFWNHMSEAVLGVSLRDWNDNSEVRFRDELCKARDEVERDVKELIEEDKAITFAIQLPDDDPREFRFRSSDLSQHGQRLLQNFKSTMGIAGRPLSIDERRKIALAFLVHVMGEDFAD